jgi:hypothetical protein
MTAMNDIGSCPNEVCPMFSAIICLFGHDIAKILQIVMTDFGSCHNKFCLKLSIGLCLVSHNIAQ